MEDVVFAEVARAVVLRDAGAEGVVLLAARVVEAEAGEVAAAPAWADVALSLCPAEPMPAPMASATAAAAGVKTPGGDDASPESAAASVASAAGGSVRGSDTAPGRHGEIALLHGDQASPGPGRGIGSG